MTRDELAALIETHGEDTPLVDALRRHVDAGLPPWLVDLFSRGRDLAAIVEDGATNPADPRTDFVLKAWAVAVMTARREVRGCQ